MDIIFIICCVYEMQKWRIYNTRRRETLLLANTKVGWR